jgi:xanthine dehydrogenase molybdenum-binding subunit
VTYKFGDAATAMTQPGITQLSSRYESALIQHNNIMPHAFTISVDTTGRVEMYTATQASKTHASDLATALGVSASRVRVYSLSSDGGFGDKGDAGGGYTAFPPEILAAILSQQLGRPVHHRWTHEENLLVSLHRSKVVFYITTGYNSSGTVMALTAQGYGTGSPYTSSSSNASGALNNFIWTYKFPNFTLNGNDGHANTYRQGPMRNPASPHPAWALSSHLDMVAAALGINPVTMMQANNMYTQGDKDQLTGYRIISIGQPDCLNRVLTLSGFMSKWKAFNKSTPLTGVVHGIGIANHATGNGGTAAAETGAIMMAADGSFNILIDNNSVGGGGRERNIIIAAEALGLPLGMVTMDNGDTDCGIDTGNTVGSGATKHVGDVIGLACLDAKSQMLARAATLLNTTTDKLTYALDGTMQIYVTATPTQSVTFAQLGGYPRIVGRGTMTLPPSTTGRVYNSAVSEVDVDTDTGLVTVTDVYQVEDIGQKIFNSGCDTQMKSGILMALGMALQEEQWPDVPTGMQLMTSHLDIKNPLVTQMPNMVVDFIQNPELPPDSYNFGAKGMGEPPINPSVPATANAIYNAVGARIYNLPMTCDKILKALGKA